MQAVEIQEEAIVAARENARLNGIANIDFYARDVRPLLKSPPHATLDAARANELARPAVVIVDPPRAGLARKALQRAAALGADRFVYVSCNPTTLAGNGAELAELGYRLTRVAPVDMFPQTHHIETVALFERTDAGRRRAASPDGLSPAAPGPRRRVRRSPPADHPISLARPRASAACSRRGRRSPPRRRATAAAGPAAPSTTSPGRW